MILENPFKMDGTWYKGNLHTHTSNSDGAWNPEKVVNEYKSNGYNFTFITDHWKVTDISNLSRDGFLVLNGEEFNIQGSELGYHYHVVGLNLKKTIPSNSIANIQELIDLIRSEGGEAVVAHPYWSGLTLNDLSKLNGHLGIEIFNSTCYFSIGKGHSVIHWDDLLNKGNFMFGFAVDDTHQHFNDHRPIDICSGWIMAKMSELSEQNVMNAIKLGHFYSSTGPIINDITVNDGKIYVSTSDVQVINFIANAHCGESFIAKDDSSITKAEYRISGNERYIRVECIDSKGKVAWSNPILANR